jgi:hypothetical protein
MVDAKYEGIIMQSMAKLGYEEVKPLRGQTTAGFSYQRLAVRMVDRPLLGGFSIAGRRASRLRAPRARTSHFFAL